MNQKHIVFLLALTGCLAVVGILATEQRAEAQAYEQWPCQEDMAKYCSGIAPGGGRLLACYEQQKANMSGKCVSWAEYLKKNAGDLRDACTKEIEARCNAEKGDPLAMLKCLQSNYIDLSPKCVNKLNQFKNYYPMPVR